MSDSSKRCGCCGQEKACELFFSTRRGLSSYCRQCNKEHSKNRYEEFKLKMRKDPAVLQKHLGDSVRRDQKTRATRRARVIAALGGKCVVCSITDARILRVDHVNGGGGAERKETGKGAAYWNEVIANKDGRFQLLCVRCHRIKTREHEDVPRPHAGESKYFGDSFPSSGGRKRMRGAEGDISALWREKRREYWLNNPGEYRAFREKQREASRICYTERRVKVVSALGAKCAFCGFDDARGLEIDHVSGGGYKDKNRKQPYKFLGYVLANLGLFRLLCSNCNTIRVYVEPKPKHWRKGISKYLPAV